MPFDIAWEPRGIYRRFYGHVTSQELLQSLSNVHGDARFDDLRFIINDFLGVDSHDVTEDTVTYIAAIDNAAARSNPHIRIAIVATDAAIRALAGRYQVSPWTTYPTRIFATVEEARAWL